MERSSSTANQSEVVPNASLAFSTARCYVNGVYVDGVQVILPRRAGDNTRLSAVRIPQISSHVLYNYYHHHHHHHHYLHYAGYLYIYSRDKQCP